MHEADPRRTYRQKWPGQTARIAGVLHCLSQADQGRAAHAAKITDEAMQAAIALASVLLDHADKALAMLGQDLRQERALRIMKRLRAAVEPVKSADLWRHQLRHVKSLFDEKVQYDDAVELLFKRGYVAWREEGKTTWLVPTPSALTAP